MLLAIGLTLVVTGAVTVAWAARVAWDESRSPRLLCLMYHRFCTPEEYRSCTGSERIYTISTYRFEEQLRHLRDAGFHSVSVEDAAAFAVGERDLPQPAVLITIDDGCRSVASKAEPLLRKYGMRATLFVTTDPAAPVFSTGGPDQERLSDDELRSLDPRVIDIQSHGHSHRPLTSLSDAELRRDLATSRQTLERIIGRPVRYLAAPGGWYDDRVRRMAADVGFVGVCTSDVGAIRRAGDPLRMRRINVSGTYDIAAFRRSIQPLSVAKRRIKKAIVGLPKRVLGPRLWEPLGHGLRSVLSGGPVRSVVLLSALGWAAAIPLLSRWGSQR